MASPCLTSSDRQMTNQDCVNSPSSPSLDIARRRRRGCDGLPAVGIQSESPVAAVAALFFVAMMDRMR
jgi:hypothetical protein